MKEEKSVEQSLTHEPAFCFLYVRVNQLIELGISRSTVNRKIKAGEWKIRDAEQGGHCKSGREILASSLPPALQLKLAQQKISSTRDNVSALIKADNFEHLQDNERKFCAALLRYQPGERLTLLDEALRLASIVTRYGEIKQKRQRNKESGKYEFVPGVYELCEEAACKDQVILVREPNRANPPSPFTIDDWWRDYQENGLLTFLRSAHLTRRARIDRRRAIISTAALEWVNTNWKIFKSPYRLYKDLQEKAKIYKWKIPSESWFYRLWDNIPKIVKVYLFEGLKAYEAKCALYVPRDFSDLEALQVLCGDHSERDITVSLPDGTLARPWATIWYDLRTGLIWGWHLSLAPSSYTAGLAYANGVQNFGAQPFSRSADSFFSFIYTDRGRDYKSHNWDGKVISVHKQAMQPGLGLQSLIVNYRVGIVDELDLKHLYTRGRNPKENPVERIHGIISAWEENTFPEYCGRHPSDRPDAWRKLYVQHLQFMKERRDNSPFRGFDQYREAFAEFVARFNSSAHERLTLGGSQIIPIEEFHRLYTTRYEIASQTLALLLMKVEKRRIRKNGIQCFQQNWFYFHEAMSAYKGKDVEVRYSDDDYNHVWVVLPDLNICEAQRITPTSLLNPNKQTLVLIKKMRAKERALINDFHLVTQSNIRGETIEDRVARQLASEDFELDEVVRKEAINSQGAVQRLTRMDKKKLGTTQGNANLTVKDVAEVETEELIFVPECLNPFEIDEG
jgi:hypothetical protein